MINNYHRVRCLLKSDLNNINFVKSFYKITKNLLKNIKLIFYYSLTRFLVNNDYRTKNFVLFCDFWIPQDFFFLIQVRTPRNNKIKMQTNFEIISLSKFFYVLLNDWENMQYATPKYCKISRIGSVLGILNSIRWISR